MTNRTQRFGWTVFLAVLFWSVASAQVQHSITSPTIDACDGALQDSGGPNGQYSNNENFTTVICPSVPGDVVTLQFVIANLDQSGAQNTWDRIRIWDGDNTTTTFLGDYTGADNLVGVVFQATNMNPTGCLTVQFISNGSGTGDFAAILSCETPCERPTASGSMSDDGELVVDGPAMICVGEPLDFDGNASYPQGDFEIVSYTWDFRDGNTAPTATATHSWSEPGEYVVQLYVVDDNGCVNTNVIDLQVLVSTTPNFGATAISDQVSCVGTELILDASGTFPLTWTGIPDTGSDEDVTLSDLIGVPFTSTITASQFLPGQTLTTCADLLSVCVDMEHSFMGDLVISLTCPSGQTQVLHQQGGGGTDLGIPGTGGAGTPYNYCFSSSATNGTWVDNSGGPTLPAGAYEPVQTCELLEGCPLNGTWTITFLDLWAADDGNLFGWNLNFNPAIIPDVTEFTPILGTASLDSAGWTGTNVILDATNPLVATASISAPGEYEYSFFVTDNFGCVYDTTMTVSVPEIPVLDAGPDIVLCSDPLPMAGEIIANGPPNSCVFELVLYDSAGDSWNSGANIDVTVAGSTTNYTLPCCPGETTIPLSVQTGDAISLDFQAGTNWNYENSFTLFDDAGNALFESPYDPPTGVLYSGVVSCVGGSSPFTYVWTPTTGLTDPNDPTTDVFVTEPTMFYLSTYPTGYPECAVTDSVLVAPDPSIDAGLSNAIILCASDPVILLTDSLEGTPDAGGVWTDGAGMVVPNAYDPSTGTSDIFTYTVVSDGGCTATSTLEITVIPADDPTCCGVVDAGPATFSCDLTNVLQATRGNTGVGNWTGPVGAVFGDATQDTTTVTMPAGSGGTHMFYWVENDGAFCNLIDSVEKTFTDAYAFEPTLVDALCFSYCDGEAQVAVTGGNAANGLTYEWSNGDEGVDLELVEDLCAGTYTLVVRDDNGCEGSTTFTIAEPILVEIDSMATVPVTCSGDCDGQVELYDAEAVDYSYDGGASWTAANIRTEACEGIYNVMIRNAIGCEGTGAIVVTGPPPVVADFIWGPNPANVDNPRIEFLTTSSDAERFFWNIADLASSTETRPVFTFSDKEPGIYEVCLVAYNYNDCADSICKNVIIDDVLFTYIPNSFTPDGDDVNDAWGMVVNIPVITDFELLVFDRWGQVVYNTTDLYDPWLGSYQNGGEVLKSDVYAYRILYGIEGTEARKELVGHVTLIK